MKNFDFFDLMKIKRNLKKLNKIQKRNSNSLIHKLHTENKISKRTLLYIKEYGPHSNISKTIIKESIKIVLFASLLSSIGGLALENIKFLFLSLFPLIILIPILNDIVGDYGTIISSRFSTIIHKTGNSKLGFKNKDIQKLYFQIKIISLITVILACFSSFVITFFMQREINYLVAIKILLICLIDVFLLVNIMFFISIYVGIRLYKKGHDPDNYLIPITTSFADLGNMIILAVLVMLFF